MFSMDERYPYRESDRPRRPSQLPSYLQDYEVGYPATQRRPHDEQVRQTTPPEVMQYIHNMREEHDELRRDVRRLTEAIASLPVLATHHPMSRSRLREGETSSTPAPASKLMPVRGHEDPHQLDSAPQVPARDKSPLPRDSHHDTMEELVHSLKGAGLDQGAAQPRSSSGESSPQSQDFSLHTVKGENIRPIRHSTDERQPPQPYPNEHTLCQTPGVVSSQPTRYQGAHPDDNYYRQDPNYPSSARQSRSDSRFRPAQEYGYHGHTDQSRNWDNRYPGYPDRLRPNEGLQIPAPLSRPPQIETYRGPQPSIPNLVHEDPREFARLKLALDNILPYEAPEHFKFQILTDHLKCEEALLIADSYSNSPFPFSDTMRALTEMYGQPQHLALKRITTLMDGPPIRSGDIRSFKSFALQVRALVGMLHQLGEQGRTELRCGSHVSRLLAKLPYDLRANFQRFVNPIHTPVPTLLDLGEWLEYEVRVQVIGDQYSDYLDREKPAPRKERRPELKSYKTTTILHGSEQKGQSDKDTTATQEKPKKYCPFCDTVQHYLNQCSEFKLLSRPQKTEWIKINKRCWRCGRNHLAAKCNLKAKCRQCERRHLEVLHEVNTSQNTPVSVKPSSTEESACLVSSISETLYVDRPTNCSQVLLKLSRVILKSGTKAIETYAILDDGSERTILLREAAERLGLQGEPEDLALRTVRQEVCTIHGATVSFSVAPVSQPGKTFQINRAFTAQELGLARHTYPVKALQERYQHLKDLPLPDIREVQPLLLIGSDNPHLITPMEPVRLGPPGGPAAVHTRLGWTLQGPSKFLRHRLTPKQCLFTSCNPLEAELFRHVERLWQMDTLPYQSERLITRSRQDAEAIRRLDEKTIRVTVDGVKRYATPLLWKENLPPLCAPQEAVLAQLRGTEKRLARDPERAATYSKEIHKLLDAGYVTPVSAAKAATNNHSWFIPHHMVHHNGKDRIVFNCSFKFEGQSLNDHLLPGPNLGASLLGVLLRFREHPVAISSDVKGMFHQVRLLDEDKPFLCFLWRDMKVDEKPTVYQWQVLPFGTACSPCCAIFALQSHVHQHTKLEDGARLSVERHFYVDNWLQSLPSEVQAKKLVDHLQNLLMEGGFELRQWATNVPAVIGHLPVESRSESSVLWFSQEAADFQERTLGLVWQCKSDTLRYKQHLSERPEPTMRNIYRLLAKQYDPLGFLVPYTTRAKVIVQRLWNKKRGWDDPHLPEDLLQAWRLWESELPQLSQIILPRCYADPKLDWSTSTRSIHQGQE
ncbi:uncharacterized protein ACNS7B_006885 [Menidia menidia]